MHPILTPTQNKNCWKQFTNHKTTKQFGHERFRQNVELGAGSVQLPILKTELRSAPAPSKILNLSSTPLQLRGAGS